MSTFCEYFHRFGISPVADAIIAILNCRSFVNSTGFQTVTTKIESLIVLLYQYFSINSNEWRYRNKRAIVVTVQKTEKRI
jgi:hypothetical protein